MKTNKIENIKKLLLLTFFSISLTSLCQSKDYLDELNGYKDLKFNKTKKELNSKIFDCTSRGTCLIIGDKYRKIRDVKIENVYTTFLNQKLSSIILIVKGKENVNELLRLYKETFGKASGRTKGKLEVFWVGEKVILNYEIKVNKSNQVSAIAIITEKNVLSENNRNEIKRNLEDF